MDEPIHNPGSSDPMSPVQAASDTHSKTLTSCCTPSMVHSSHDAVSFEVDGEKRKLLEVKNDVVSETKDRSTAESDGWIGMLWQPFKWFGMLCRELNGTFVFGVIVTYGVSQGMGGAFYQIVGGYYWKDVQKVQPSAAQVYKGIIQIPWEVKPIWGFLTDLLPVAGYHRRPYFVLSGILAFTSTLVLAFSPKLHVAVAVALLLVSTSGVTIADVTIDAVIAKQSHEQPLLAPDIQTLCSIVAAIGALTGFSSSGLAVDALGPKEALGLLSISGVLFLILGFILRESRLPKHSLQSSQVGRKLRRMGKNLWTTMSCPQVWKPTLYMFISWATAPSITEAKFFWCTDPKLGLGFSQKFIGVSYAVSTAGAFIGTLTYQRTLKNKSFRSILFWAQLLVFLSGTFDLVLFLRLNLKVHLPDSLFFIFDEIVLQFVSRLKWIPQLVLCTKLCPAGIEGTFFALLMTVDNLGLMSASWNGALLLHILGVTREDYSKLWLAALIRNLLRLLPMGLLFLIPNTDPSMQVIPAELVGLGREEEEEEEEEDKVELVITSQSQAE